MNAQKIYLPIILLAGLLFQCENQIDTPIDNALNLNTKKIQTVVTNLDAHEVQILFSKIRKDSTEQIQFQDFEFQVNDSNYFYPASSVKLPIAILALEKLSTMPLINRNTSYQLQGDSVKTTMSEDIIKIFAVSDNDAYNRLFEFLGKDYINHKLNSKGIKARISHRLSIENSADLNYKAINFYERDSLILSSKIKSNKNINLLKLKGVKKGIGYTINDSLVKEPMDFSKKNYLPINSLHGIMKRLMFPEHFSKTNQFNLTDADREFLINTMSILPREAGYEDEDYYDSYVKFLVFGDLKTAIPQHIKIHNKVGYAYGYLTDCAYIINTKTNQSYMITATIHVNKNQIYNDGIYEYETIGIPFLSELGRQLIN